MARCKSSWIKRSSCSIKRIQQTGSNGDLSDRKCTEGRLKPIEEALAYQQLIREFDLTQEEIAARVAKSRVAITNTMLPFETG